MKKLQQDLINALKEFINKKCIKVDIPVGTVFYIYFGNLTYFKSKNIMPKTGKIHLTSDYNFYFDWQWNIISKSKIIASSRIYDDKVYLHTLKQIEILKDKVLLDFKFNRISNELTLFFEDDIIVQTFNDIVRAIVNNELGKQSIAMVFTPSAIYDALANSKIEYQQHKVEYVTDYEENKEKYNF